MRPHLTTQLDSKTFSDYYYLKEELIAFCKEHQLQATGSKEDLNTRIIHYLNTGEKLINKKTKKKVSDEYLTLDSIITLPITYSENKRAFFSRHIGSSFHFNVPFQRWLKNNAGKTYRQAIDAYYILLEEKKLKKENIDKQFEYNTYIRDFFADNKGKTLPEAIRCWKYKKSVSGTNKYESKDLVVLENDS